MKRTAASISLRAHCSLSPAAAPVQSNDRCCLPAAFVELHSENEGNLPAFWLVANSIATLWSCKEVTRIFELKFVFLQQQLEVTWKFCTYVRCGFFINLLCKDRESSMEVPFHRNIENQSGYLWGVESNPLFMQCTSERALSLQS